MELIRGMDVNIGKTFILCKKGHEDNGQHLTVRDQFVKKMHRNQNDQRTKLVDTSIYSLVTENRHEYRWTAQDINNRILEGSLVDPDR
jgi:hypothetical protein